jgi:integrase
MQGLALMARPRRGTLKRRPTKQGISYGVAFTYRGEEFYEHFGGEWEGWDEERTAEEQRFLIERSTVASRRRRRPNRRAGSRPRRLEERAARALGLRVPRRVVIDTLILGGLRVSELCGLDGPHLDVVGGRLRVPRSATKSDAGERNVPTVPALRQGLTERRKEYPSGQGEPAFPTRNGTRQHPDNIRARILAPIRQRANKQLEAEGLLLIGHMTPHTLRRTFASMLAVCDVPPRRAMYLMGHTDPTLTLAVYQQVLDMGKGAVEILEQPLGCTLAEARAIYNGEARAAKVDDKA